jgi:hypothetical protein
MASASNTLVSKPVENSKSVDVFMNGFAWSSDEGLFIPTTPSEILFDEPLNRLEVIR